MILSHLPCLSGKSLISLIIYSRFLPICFQKEQTERLSAEVGDWMRRISLDFF